MDFIKKLVEKYLSNFSQPDADDLLTGEGVVVGYHKGKYLRSGSADHVMVIGPARSGKGVGIVLPNLLTWNGSTVVVDIAKECWETTAGYRASLGHKVLMFDPLQAEGRTVRYNPFSHIDRSDNRLYDELRRMASILLPGPGKGSETALEAIRQGFVAIAGYIAETPELPFTLGEVYRQLSVSADLPVYDEAQSVRDELLQRLDIWSHPLVDQATSDNDFDLRDFRSQPHALYIGVMPSNLYRLAPLIRLLLHQVVYLNTRTMPKPDDKHELLVIIDEFQEAIGDASALVRDCAGGGVCLVTTVVGLSQLDGIYGKAGASAIRDSADLQVIHTPRSLEDCTELCEPLSLSVEALLLMPFEEQIVVTREHGPIRCNKILHYRETLLRDRVLPADLLTGF